MSHLCVNKIVCQLHIEHFALQLNIELCKDIFQVLQVKTKFRRIGVLEHLRKTYHVDVGNLRHPHRIRIRAHHHIGPVEEYRHILGHQSLQHLARQLRLLHCRCLLLRRRQVKQRRLPTLHFYLSTVLFPLSVFPLPFHRLLRVLHAQVGEYSPCQLAEFQLVEYLAQLRVVGFLPCQRLLVEGYRGVEPYRGQHLREEGLLAVLAHLLPQAVVLDLVHPLHHLFHRTELRYELLRRLLPHPRYAGNVVDGVAPQAQQVYHLAAVRNVVLLAHLLHPHQHVRRLAPPLAVHLHPLRYQLRKILVRRHHHHLVEPRRLGSVAQCANHVVGLVALACQPRNPERIDDTAYPRQVALNLLRHRVTVGLVFGIHLVAEGGFGEVKGHPHMSGPLVLQQVIQSHREPKRSRRVHPLRVHTRIVAHRIIATIHRRHPVSSKP